MFRILGQTPILSEVGSELFVKLQLTLSLNKPQIATLKVFRPPPEFKDIEWPEERKLKFTPKVPVFQSAYKPVTMRKMIYLMRGPELVHNFLLHKQYGIQALTGGRMRASNFEFLRAALSKINYDKAFAVWRVDEPWQAVSRKGSNKKMGGGKSPIHHYVTPVRAGRIILEFGGTLHPREVFKKVAPLAENLPFPARFVTQEMLEKEAKQKEEDEKNNLNKYTMKYVILNNIGGCKNWLSPYDYDWYGEYR